MALDNSGNAHQWLGGVLFACSLLLACSQQPKPTANSSTPPPYVQSGPSNAGTITGKILFTGKKLPGKKVDMDEDPQCAKLHTTAVTDDRLAVNSNGTLANVFVYIKQGLEDKTFAPSSEAVTIEQKGCWFGPRVLGIQVGQTLKVINADPVSHNIHPQAQTNREWNQNQPPGAEAFTRKFTQPEVMIRVKCNIHGWMHAWIGVVAHPYFAVTGADGAFQLRNVPPGQYVIETWQEEFGKQEQPITLAPSGKSELTFTYK